MREYTLGTPNAKEALEALSGRTELMYKHFFGIENASYYNIEREKKRNDEAMKVWDDYGVVSKGSKMVLKGEE